MALVFITGLEGSCSKSGLQGRVAQVYGKDIFISDLNPSDEELKRLKKSYPNLSDDEVLNMARPEKLSSLIWPPIMEEFGKTHNVEPSEEELLSFGRAMDASKADLPPEFADKIPKLSSDMAREINQPFVKTWKISKALYEEFGGTVIFQQANPMEPVGAYRKLLETHERKGDFKIFDEKIKQQFWNYYVKEQPFQVPQGEVDYSVPWWLKKRP
jgi:hypothetical protein